MPSTVLIRLVLVVAALSAQVAHAEIYKCVAKGRLPVYQNFPCPLDRLESPPPDARDAGSNASAKSAAGIEQDPNVAASTREPRQRATPAGVPARPSVPGVGMTTDEIRAIWGEPLAVTKEELTKKDIEVWTYADSRSIEFDRKGVVTTIRW
jgi:hypothetical protein